MKNKKTFAVLLVLILAIAAMGWIWQRSRPQTATDEKTISITIVHSDGTSKTFSCKTTEEYLGQVLLNQHLAEGSIGPYGLEIHTAGGETASWEENQSYWALYIGTDYATTGADGIALTNGGEYALVYTIG